jgi:hypothetical protein
VAMQKVITIKTHTYFQTDKNKTGYIDEHFFETEYPLLDKYLKEGYTVSQVIQTLKPSEASHYYALTFVLDKK